MFGPTLQMYHHCTEICVSDVAYLGSAAFTQYHIMTFTILIDAETDLGCSTYLKPHVAPCSLLMKVFPGYIGS